MIENAVRGVSTRCTKDTALATSHTYETYIIIIIIQSILTIAKMIILYIRI